jgi:hypothetical protein
VPPRSYRPFFHSRCFTRASCPLCLHPRRTMAVPGELQGDRHGTGPSSAPYAGLATEKKPRGGERAVHSSLACHFLCDIQQIGSVITDRPLRFTGARGPTPPPSTTYSPPGVRSPSRLRLPEVFTPSARFFPVFQVFASARARCDRDSALLLSAVDIPRYGPRGTPTPLELSRP